MSVVDDIKSKLDIVQYVSRTTPLKRAGRLYKACCPFHGEKTPSFYVDPNRQTWRCYGACATGGDVFSFAMLQNGWTFAEALTELGKLTGVEVRPRSPEQKAHDESLERIRGLLKAAAEFYHEYLLDSHDTEAHETLQYARGKRDLSDATIDRFMIGYAPAGWQTTFSHFRALGFGEEDLLEAGLVIRSENGRVYDRFRHRLMIPIRDERGRTVGFGARALAAEDQPKYLNSPLTSVFDKSRVLFGLDLAGPMIRQLETVVIVEGYLDAIQAHQAGFTNVVAQMGTALTETQLKLVAPRWASKIVLALDSDAAGQNATRRSLDVAREALQADYGGRLSVDIRILALPGAKDPDDLIREHPEQWQALIDTALPVADYVIAMETAELPPKASLQEREAVARRLLPILIASENDLYRKVNIQQLALRLHIAERDLLSWAQEQQQILALTSPRHLLETRAPLPMDAAPPNFDERDDRLATGLPSALASAPARSPENTLERDCLRLLLFHPEFVFHVNRKFRELADGDERLLRGPLNDLRVDDFSRTEYRVLAGVFGEALEQDAQETLEYMRGQLEGELRQELEAILAGDLELLRSRLRNGLSVDLETIVQTAQRVHGASDPAAEVIEMALRLRRQRLEREREEIKYLQLETGDKDYDIEENYNSYIILSNRAKQLIETFLSEQRRARR
jgi:DNA primase